MRLFIAIDLDDAARSAIAKEQKRIAAAIDRGDKALTWVAPDRMHLTLVFLGEIADASASSMIASIERGMNLAPFDAVFAGVGVFPPDRPSARSGPPRVLWLGVSDGADAVAALQNEMASRMTSLGAALEDRAFNPHLTLARWKRSKWSDRRRVEEVAHQQAVARIHVDHATLYQSRLSSAGPSYTPLARARLFAGM